MSIQTCCSNFPLISSGIIETLFHFLVECYMYAKYTCVVCVCTCVCIVWYVCVCCVCVCVCVHACVCTCTCFCPTTQHNSSGNAPHNSLGCLQVYGEEIYVFSSIPAKEGNSLTNGSFSIQWFYCQVSSSIANTPLSTKKLYTHLFIQGDW